ncbi:MAG: hypothetical protein AB1846_04920 [Chloroflexota bacterium]
MDEQKKQTSKEVIALVIALGIVSIVCIVACASVAITFIINAPW